MVAWQVEHLQTHKYFRPLQSTGSDMDNSGTLDSFNGTRLDSLPPAGNLIVYDKGKKSNHPFLPPHCQVVKFKFGMCNLKSLHVH